MIAKIAGHEIRVSFTNVQACGGATPIVPCPTSRDGTTIYPPELVNATGSGELECTKQVARACDPNNEEVRCNCHRPGSCRGRGRTRRPRTRCAAPCCCRGNYKGGSGNYNINN